MKYVRWLASSYASAPVIAWALLSPPRSYEAVLLHSVHARHSHERATRPYFGNPLKLDPSVLVKIGSTASTRAFGICVGPGIFMFPLEVK